MPSSHDSLAAILPAGLKLTSSSTIASLWSSYGHIYRLSISPADHKGLEDAFDPVPDTLILKSIHPPALGGDADESHLRKLLSYEVERFFYQNLSLRLPPHVKVAKSYPLNPAATSSSGGDLLLEDLTPSFPHPARGSLGFEATRCVLRWLAGFHATFWNVHLTGTVDASPLHLVLPPLQVPSGANTKQLEQIGRGVWQQGTYWYLDTRREEMASVDESGEDRWLIPWVEKINETLTYARTKHSTLTHGDVKGANIVFSQVPFRKPSSDALPLTCALYDLQYVGVNPPTHDLVYFLGTSVSSPLINSAENERELLDFYFAELSASLPAGVSYPRPVFDAHWDLSVVDWVRFMAGWGYWGNDQWATRRAKEIVQGWGAGGFTCLRDALSL